jgi:hypothetical protein
MFCSVNDSACLDISVPGLGTDAMDLPAASKNIPKAFSAWSMVFSASSRNSAGTSNFGSIMPPPSGLGRELSHFRGGVFAEFAPTEVNIVNGLPDRPAFLRNRSTGHSFPHSMERPLADFDLERAIGLRWALRDVLSDRLKLAPVPDDDPRALIDMGLVEMRDVALVVTQAGLAALE